MTKLLCNSEKIYGLVSLKPEWGLMFASIIFFFFALAGGVCVAPCNPPPES